MAWPHTFGNQTQINSSWWDDNFNAAAQLNTSVTFSRVSLAGVSEGSFAPSNTPGHTGALLNLAADVYLDSSGPNGSLTVSAPLGTMISVGGSAYALTVSNTLAGASGFAALEVSRPNPGTSAALVGFDVGGGWVGNITVSGSSVSYNTTSDAALKTVHGPSDGSPLSALPIRDCTFTGEGAGATLCPMILAQECKAVAPWAVTPGSPDGKTPCMIDYSKLVAPLIAYAQALEARIAVLEAKALVTAPATSPGLIAARSALASAAALPVVQAAIARGVALKGVQNGITQAQTL